jgi:hypothetical protein
MRSKVLSELRFTSVMVRPFRWWNAAIAQT